MATEQFIHSHIKRHSNGVSGEHKLWCRRFICKKPICFPWLVRII